VKSSSQRPCILTPSDLVIATKVGFARRGPGPWTEDGRPQRLREAVHGSLSRLRIDRIDLLQLHRIDPKVPVEDQLGTLKDLQADGLIRFVGLFEVSIEQLERARTLVDVVSMQNLYNLVDRWADPLLGRCEEYLGFLPWSPLRIGDSRPGQAHSLMWPRVLARRPPRSPSPGCSTNLRYCSRTRDRPRSHTSKRASRRQNSYCQPIS
jgi:diketogulonate reductase-like aldo/keto reductase